MFRGIRRFFKKLGPGVITGAADDDPSGIATYTQTGAQFGYGQLWTTVFILPFLISIQEACARIGAATGKGIAKVIKENYSKKLLYFTVFLVVFANTINIGADIGAMAEAANLVFPIGFPLFAIIFTAIILILEIFVSYKNYAKILKWLALSLLAYPLTLILISHPWVEVLKATFVPHVEFSFSFFFIITGVLGTTISPYMFFWEASEEVEEEREKHMIHRDAPPTLTKKFLHDMRLDNFVGMLSTQAATWAIIVVAGTVLYSAGINNVENAADAARALEPLVQTFPNAGYLAKVIFAVGIVGLGLLAVPVLSGSASYALSEALNWKEGLNLKLKRAHGFYGIITIATLIGLSINFIGIDPIKALVFAAVLNGVVAVPLIFIIARVAGNSKIMGEHRSSKLSNVFVWMTFVIMLSSSVAMFYSLFSSRF